MRGDFSNHGVSRQHSENAPVSCARQTAEAASHIGWKRSSGPERGWGMNALDDRGHHEEIHLLLPWLANGHLAPAERETAQAHVRRCKECERELAAQQLMCDALTLPDRVTYAPGPSFRKLMDRI